MKLDTSDRPSGISAVWKKDITLDIFNLCLYFFIHHSQCALCAYRASVVDVMLVMESSFNETKAVCFLGRSCRVSGCPPIIVRSLGGVSSLLPNLLLFVCIWLWLFDRARFKRTASFLK